MTVLPAGLAPLVSDAVAERQRHLGRERTLKAIAALMGLSSLAGLLGGIVTQLLYFGGTFEFNGYELPNFIFGQVLSVVMLWGSWRLWRLDRWGLFAIGLWAASLTFSAAWMVVGPAEVIPSEAEEAAAFVGYFIIGIATFFALLATYLWWLTFARKSRRVVSEQYQTEVMAQTPQISNHLAATTLAALLILTLFNLYVAIFPALEAFKPAS